MVRDADVLIIGSGMGGATLAYALAGTGHRVHVLERGQQLPLEPENWSVEEVFRKKRYRAVEIWKDRFGKAFNPGIHYWVGGNTKVYGGCMMRLRPRDFEAVEHHGGLSPAWPVTYSEIEPFYAQAEEMMHVRGLAGADPGEGPRSISYPHAPIADDPTIATLSEGLRQRGLRPFPLPSSVQQGDGGGCIRCKTCDGFPCQVDAKGDAENCCLRPALTTGNVTLETGALVRRLLTTSDGRRVDAVEIEKDGSLELRRSPVVVLAAGAINSAALLLRSANAVNPNGLANRSGLVGRNYMAHNPTGLMCVHPLKINETVYQKTISINDYYWGTADFPYPMGNLQMLGKLQAGMLAASMPFAPRALMAALANRSIDWYVMSEDLPDPENRVVLDGASLKLIYKLNNLEGHRRLVRIMRGHMRALGYAICIGQHFGLATTSHQCGTVRFGDDPANSVLDPLCRAWDIENLYVIDGAFMPSSAAVNPALTIAAQALRVGRHLRERLGSESAPKASA